MLPVNVASHHVTFGTRFTLYFLRTLRVPDHDKSYPLPPGLGEFPIFTTEQIKGIKPGNWSANDLFLCLYQREALWLGFDAAQWKPNAVKVGAGEINVLTGDTWNNTLHSDPQDYLVCPPQPWLDGFKTGDGIVRQFVAAPLGSNVTVESQLTGGDVGGLRVTVFEPRSGHFPDSRPPPKPPTTSLQEQIGRESLGLAAGGEIRQKIYADPYGLETWDDENYNSVLIHILNSTEYAQFTGSEPPPTPISAETYTQCGFPWYETYDEDRPGLPATTRLGEVKSFNQQTGGSDETLDVPDWQIKPAKKMLE